jgi:hypothetical protein
MKLYRESQINVQGHDIFEVVMYIKAEKCGGCLPGRRLLSPICCEVQMKERKLMEKDTGPLRHSHNVFNIGCILGTVVLGPVISDSYLRCSAADDLMHIIHQITKVFFVSLFLLKTDHTKSKCKTMVHQTLV